MGASCKLKNGFFVLIVLTCCSLAHGQLTAATNAGKPPNTLTCSPAPCALPNVQVDDLTYGGEPGALVPNPNSTNEMVLAAHDANCFSDQGFYSTADGGSTWSAHSCILSNNPGGQPIVGYDLNNRVFGGGSDDLAAILLRYSDNNGVHWSRSRVVDASPFGVLSPQITVDTSLFSPFENSIYVYSVHGGVSGLATRVVVSHSSDGGKHWKAVPLDQWQIPNWDSFPRLSVGEDGTLYATWLRCDRPQGGFCVKDAVPILLSKSVDGGMSWTPPSVIATTNLAPGNCLYGCLPNARLVLGVPNDPVNAVVGSGATAGVYVVFYNWTGTQMQVEVVTSTDGGKTFGSPVPVSNSNVGDQFLSWISAAPDGTIAVSWMDRRNDPANAMYQPFLATSVDGLHFNPSWQLSSQLSDPNAWGLIIVETVPSLWVGNAVYSTWTDTRSGLPRPELGGVQF